MPGVGDSTPSVVGAASDWWRGAHPPVVRVGGLPTTVLGQLRFAETTTLIEQITQEQRRLADESAVLSVALHELIGTCDRRVRPRLVGLRRSLHQLRRPARSEWSAGVRVALPPELTGRIEAFLAGVERLRGERKRLVGVHAEEVDRGMGWLREIVAAPEFRRALWLSSPTLTTELDKWLADPERPPRPQAVFRLAKYVARAATKTSPRSTFTVSGFGRWQAGAPMRLRRPEGTVGILELHGGVRDRLQAALSRHPGCWERLWLRANPSATRCGDSIRFLGPRPTEPLLSLPATPGLAECLRLLRTDAPVQVAQLRHRLAAATGEGADVAEAYLRRLVAAGLIEAWPATGDGAGQLDALAGWVREAAHARPQERELAGLAETLTGAAATLRDPLPVAAGARYRRVQQVLAAAVSEVARRLEGSGNATPAIAATGAEQPEAPPAPSRSSPASPKAVASEVAVVTGHLAECDPLDWSQVRSDLGVIRQWLAGFNSVLPLRLALADWWHERLGLTGEVPFLELHRAVQGQLRGEDAQAQEVRSSLRAAFWQDSAAVSAFPRVRQLRTQQEAALRIFESGEGRAEQAEVRVSPAAVAAAAERWPDWVPSVGSLGCYVQPLVEDDVFSVVLNLVDTGYGRGASRLARLVRHAGGAADGFPAAVEPHGPLLAELAGDHGSSLNDRLPSVPYEVDYPFTAATAAPRSASQRLPLSDLLVWHDPAIGLLRLRSRRLGAEVKAMDLGMLMRPLLPPAARLLVQLFGELPMLAPARLPIPTAALPAVGEVSGMPRIWVGRVLLRRRSWLTRAQTVPQRDAGEGDAEYLLRLWQWRTAEGLPQRCFVRVRRPVAAQGLGRLVLDKARKPIYIDFASWFLVRGLENALTADAEWVVFEEALPDPELADRYGEARVVELLVEVTGGS